MNPFFLFALSTLLILSTGGSAAANEAAKTAVKESEDAIDFDEARESLKVKGQLINPKIIFEFIPWVSDPNVPIILEMDLGQASSSNRYFQEFKMSGNQAVSEEDGVKRSYRWVGRLQSGLHVVHAVQSGSGSMVQNHALVLSVSRQPLKQIGTQTESKNGHRVSLRVERVYNLGDRAISKFEIKENSLTIQVTCERTCDSKRIVEKF